MLKNTCRDSDNHLYYNFSNDGNQEHAPGVVSAIHDLEGIISAIKRFRE